MRFPQRWTTYLRRLFRELLAMLYALRDKRVPFFAKCVAAFPLVYLIMPMDIIPDMIPILGWLDDVAMLPVAAYAFERMVPFAVLSELRAKADRQAFRYGPRFLWIAVGIVAFWMVMAGLGGWYYYRSLRDDPHQPRSGQPVRREDPTPQWGADYMGVLFK